MKNTEQADYHSPRELEVSIHYSSTSSGRKHSSARTVTLLRRTRRTLDYVLYMHVCVEEFRNKIMKWKGLRCSSEFFTRAKNMEMLCRHLVRR